MPEQLSLSLEMVTEPTVAPPARPATIVRPVKAHRRAGASTTAAAADEWRIDERTREVGRRGLAEARRALARSGHHAAAA